MTWLHLANLDVLQKSPSCHHAYPAFLEMKFHSNPNSSIN